MGSATRYLDHPESFVLQRGGRLPSLRLAYEQWGTLNAERNNAVLLFTGLSPGAHAASSAADPSPGWWEAMIGPGKAIDSDRFYVLCVNSLGSCHGSTGPASIDPATGQAWRLRFPDLTIDDIARATERVTAALGIERLQAIIGPSMGGMTALAWIKAFPLRSHKLALISTACSSTPFALAIRSVQREAIVTDRHFLEGHYDEDRWPEVGMRLARKLGMMTYRSAAEWDQRFGRRRQDYFPPTRFGMQFEVESYLEQHARKFVGQFDPCCYLYLSRAMDWFDACDSDQSLIQLFQRCFTGHALVLGVDSDLLFPLYQQRELAGAIEASGSEVSYQALSSDKGHDAFLVDWAQFERPLREWLG